MHRHDHQSNAAGPEISLTELVLQIRRAAYTGARTIIPESRHDLIQDIVSWTLLEIARRRQRSDLPPIANIGSYALKIAQHEAQHVFEHEQETVSLDADHIPSADSIDVSVTSNVLNEGIIEPGIVIREDVINALPELFDRFKTKVLEQLSHDEKVFFQLYFVDRLSPKELAARLNIQPRSVIQKWRRLLDLLHTNLLDEMRSWPQGRDLFLDVLRDQDRIAEFLCLLRVFNNEGFDGVRALIDSLIRH